MIKRRIIACVIIKDGIAVQSFSFSRYLPIGKPEIAVESLNLWNADEILVVDIDAAKENRCIDPNLVHRLSKKCFVPLTVGGGIRTVTDISKLLASGADKVLVNSGALENISALIEFTQYFGNQCIIGEIDCIKSSDGQFFVYNHVQKKITKKSVLSWALELQNHGAGEILINSVDRDGLKQGYELTLLKEVGKALSVPLIACGGVGHPSHIIEAWGHKEISAFAAGNIFQFSEHSVTTIKAFMEMKNIPQLRIDDELVYTNFEFDNLGRPVAPSEAPF